MKITDYLIEGGFDPEDQMLVDEDKNSLMLNVELALKTGWQPFGSPFLDKEGCMCQAMVMYKSLD